MQLGARGYLEHTMACVQSPAHRKTYAKLQLWFRLYTWGRGTAKKKLTQKNGNLYTETAGLEELVLRSSLPALLWVLYYLETLSQIMSNHREDHNSPWCTLMHSHMDAIHAPTHMQTQWMGPHSCPEKSSNLGATAWLEKHKPKVWIFILIAKK